MTTDQVYNKIGEAAKTIAKSFQPEKIILFGSYAWGNPGPDSDVDFFIIKETEDTRSIAREIDGSLWGRTIPMDFVVYTPSQVERRKKSNFFIKKILENGQVLYSK